MKKLTAVLALLIIASLAFTACAPAVEPVEEPVVEEEAPVVEEEAPVEDMCMGAASGDELTMLYQWSGAEEERLNEILAPFVDACGIVLKPEASRDQALLDTKVQAGTPPDIAFYNVAQLVQYEDVLKPMDTLGASGESYADFFKDPGTVNGKWLGLPVKADIKTIVWYSPAMFEAKGYIFGDRFYQRFAIKKII